MISNAIQDDDIVLNLHEKGMYGHICDLCTHWNGMVDICNGQSGPLCCPENALDQQLQLLKMLNWFLDWRIMHDRMLSKKHASEFIFLQMRLGFV